MKNYSILLLFFLYGAVFGEIATKKAVITAPVADLFFDQLSSYDKKFTISNLYFNVPLASDNTRYGCLRSAQALYNEVVIIVKEAGDEVCIDNGRLFFDLPDRKPQRNFWTHRKNIMTFDELQKKKIDLSVFPEPILFEKPESVHNSFVVTLIWPWYDPITQKKYSVGTRFVRKPEHDSHDSFAITIFDIQDRSVKESYVPKNYCFVEKKLTRKERQKLYIGLLTSWVKNLPGIVPYVWGGASIIDTLSEDNFFIESGVLFGEKISYYVRPASKQPHAGLDCSGAISRAAQIFGIPYFYKNTITLARHLRPLAAGEKLEDGDLIWYSGHVIIINNVKENTLLEASGYPAGYGELHILPLSKKFLNIKTYKDLVEAYNVQKPIKVLHKDGTTMRVLTKYVIYKFSSVWDLL